MSVSALLQAAERHVKSQLQKQGVDASHDWDHVMRVKNLAKRLAREEECDDIEIIDLAATLHDVEDYKYSGSADATAASVKGFLESQGAAPDLIERILRIIASVGFKDELGGASQSLLLEAAVVQDADRLDAIGAVGIARCFTFGGRFNRKLYDPQIPPRVDLSKEVYMAKKEKSTTINHFHEKLLKLKGMMKTAAGRRLAERRHAFMEQYLAEFYAECEGSA